MDHHHPFLFFLLYDPYIFLFLYFGKVIAIQFILYNLFRPSHSRFLL